MICIVDEIFIFRVFFHHLSVSTVATGRVPVPVELYRYKMYVNNFVSPVVFHEFSVSHGCVELQEFLPRDAKR